VSQTAAIAARPGTAPSFEERPRRRRRRLASGVALGIVVAVGAGLAIALHRNGHTQGDDFALYLRQAQSIFDGNLGEVVADNRFTVINSGGRFSPYAYPWGWPLLLSPFVHLWGLDYDNLKLVEVACFCAWLVFVHGIVRRRAGRLLALGVTAVLATSPVLLSHTDQLLSEYPHALALAVFVWWFDRVSARGGMLRAPMRQLVVLGVLAAVAFNVRRESIVLVGVFVVMQLVELVQLRRDEPGSLPWRAIGAPYLSFVVAVAGFQLLMPTMLFPDNGGGVEYVGARIGDYAGALTVQLGLGRHPALGTVIILLSIAGMVVGCIRRPRLDVPLAAVTVLSAIAVSTHFRMVERYYFQIAPWVLYFAAVTIAAVVAAARNARLRSLAAAIAVVPLFYVVAVHAVALPDDVGASQRFDRGGRQQVGPTDPTFTPVFAAVQEHTPPDSVVVFFRARTMTLYTNRRTLQLTDVERMLQRADYYAQLRNSDYSQPAVTPEQATALGMEEVWSDAKWILWKLPPPN